MGETSSRKSQLQSGPKGPLVTLSADVFLLLDGVKHERRHGLFKAISDVTGMPCRKTSSGCEMTIRRQIEQDWENELSE
jgi:hypothetical protein